MLENHSIQYSIQNETKNIHSMNLFIQIGKKYSNVTNLPKECPNSFDPHFRFKLPS